jgi:hypothetical protein
MRSKRKSRCGRRDPYSKFAERGTRGCRPDHPTVPGPAFVSTLASAPSRLSHNLPFLRSTASPDCTAPCPYGPRSMRGARCAALMMRLQARQRPLGCYRKACSSASISSSSPRQTSLRQVWTAGFRLATERHCGILAPQEVVGAREVRDSRWTRRNQRAEWWGGRERHCGVQPVPAAEDNLARDVWQRRGGS